MSEPILTEKLGDVTTITLNRPEAGNRQTDATWAEVTKMIDAAAQESRVILFKGAGDDFCLGREAMGQPGPVLEAYGVRERADTIFNLYGAFRNAKVPIIGVVQGRAVGLGCALAALCDITIASEKARFQLPEMSHRHHADHRHVRAGGSRAAQGRHLFGLLNSGDRRAQSARLRAGEQRGPGR